MKISRFLKLHSNPNKDEVMRDLRNMAKDDGLFRIENDEVFLTKKGKDEMKEIMFSRGEGIFLEGCALAVKEVFGVIGRFGDWFFFKGLTIATIILGLILLGIIGGWW